MSAAASNRHPHQGRREGDHGQRLDQARRGLTGGMTGEERKVIFASSLGTVFEWYDFYLYGSLAAIIAKHFFSGVNADHRLHLRAAGLRRGLRGAAVRRARVRPARRPRRPQDTPSWSPSLIMGLSTFVVGLLPSYASIGVAAPDRR